MLNQKKIFVFPYKNPLCPPKKVPVVDCRRIPNRYTATATDETIKGWVRSSPHFMECVHEGIDLLKDHHTIYVGCSYGRHRSMAVAEHIAAMSGAEITVFNP